MFCSKCGKEINSGNFCPFCGEKQESFSANTEDKNVNIPKKSSKGVVIGIVFAMVVVGVGIFFFFSRPSESEKFITMLKNGEYTQAAAYYQSDLAGDEKELQKVYETVTTEINSLVDSYYADSLSYDDAQNGLKAYSDFYSTETTKALQRIEELKASKDAYELAEEKFGAEEYREAYELYAKVIESDSNFSASKDKIENCYMMIKDQIFANSENLANEKDYLSAVDMLEQELDFLTDIDKENAGTKIEEYTNQYLSDNLVQFNSYLENGNYDECFALIDNMLANVRANKVITEAKNNLKTTYENYITGQVNLYLEQRDLVTCMQWIRQGQDKMPGNEVLTNLEVMLQEYYPVSLYELEPFAIGDFDLPTYDTKEDIMGNLQTNVICGTMEADDKQYHIYNIEGKYNTLKGTIAVRKDSIGSKKIGFIKIYGDDLLLWEDTSISAMTEPYDINISISGVKHLKVQMCGPGNTGWGGIAVMLCDPILQK